MRINSSQKDVMLVYAKYDTIWLQKGNKYWASYNPFYGVYDIYSDPLGLKLTAAYQPDEFVKIFTTIKGA